MTTKAAWPKDDLPTDIENIVIPLANDDLPTDIENIVIPLANWLRPRLTASDQSARTPYDGLDIVDNEALATCRTIAATLAAKDAAPTGVDADRYDEIESAILAAVQLGIEQGRRIERRRARRGW